MTTTESAVSAPVVRYVASAEGPRIAWSASGSGHPTLLSFSGFVSHLLLDWTMPPQSDFYRALADHRRLIRYDRPGTGLADREPAGFGLEEELGHLIRVLDAAGESKVALFTRNMSGGVGIAFAALHPERVSHLVVFGSSVPLLATAEHPHGVDPALSDAVERLVRAEWGVGSKTVAAIMLPAAAPEDVARCTDYQLASATGPIVADIIASHNRLDVSELLGEVRVPTLVLHRRDDRTINIVAARSMAARIPGARFVELEGSENLPYYGDQTSVIAAINSFLDPAARLLSRREVEVLALVGDGLSNRDVADRLFVSEHTVARHIANIFLKLDVTTRGAAVAQARRAGMLSSIG